MDGAVTNSYQRSYDQSKHFAPVINVTVSEKKIKSF